MTCLGEIRSPLEASVQDCATLDLSREYAHGRKQASNSPQRISSAAAFKADIRRYWSGGRRAGEVRRTRRRQGGKPFPTNRSVPERIHRWAHRLLPERGGSP